MTRNSSLRSKHKEKEEEEEGGVRALTYSGLVGRQSDGKDRPPERTESSTGKCMDVFFATSAQFPSCFWPHDTLDLPAAELSISR